MLEIESLVRKISGELTASDKISIACISTTNPVYLAFSGESESPCLVVRSANSESTKATHEISQRLYQATDGLVPEPVGLYEHKGSVYSVQRGSAGTPWFQLARAASSPEQWNRLRTKAISTLRQFHEGVQSVPDWIVRVRPGDLLRSAYLGFCEIGNEPMYPLDAIVSSLAEVLDELGSICGTCQHGDFSLNNLLIGESGITVIDLEDFGITAMPLYDEFTLALSLNSLAPQEARSSLKIELASCTEHYKHQHGFNQTTIRGLFLSHLLLRLGPWSIADKRQPYRQKLLRLLEEFVGDTDRYISDDR